MFCLSVRCAFLLFACMAACATQTIGGGGGLAGPIASSGVPGAPCQPTAQGEGCRFAPGPVRMKCDAATSTWLQVEACPAGSTCLEAPDPTSGAGTKKLTQCKATGAAAAGDAAASGDGSTTAADASATDTGATTGDAAKLADSGPPTDAAPDSQPKPDGAVGDAFVPDAGSPDASETDTGSPDLGSADLGKPDVSPPDAKPDIPCKLECAGKECGPDGCGGICKTCSSGLQCDAGKCKLIGGGVGLGVSCFAKSQACVPGSQCVATKTIDDFVCLPDQGSGKACGPGIGYCGAGLDCTFDGEAKTGLKCAAQNAAGQACGIYGGGFCQPGGQCFYTSVEYKTLKCYADVGLDEPCGQVGKGLCAAGLECVSVVKGAKSYVCKPSSPVGGACGPGVGGCEDPAECSWTSSQQTTAQCYAPGGPGATCGDFATATSCAAWLACNEAISGAGTGTCLPMKLAGQPCGYGVGWCANFLICGPKDATSGTSVCLPLGGKDAACGPGVGYCFTGYECSAPDLKSMGTCGEKCKAKGLYGNGTCDTGCLYLDPDCAQ
ncbi:MAG: hypothetical protein EXR79_13715 [Myxococcales bacterium]|nr:hypothetical protein [Myxococcales bacterium]